MALHVLHGCTRQWRDQRQSMVNFVSESALRRYLGRLERRYQRWPADDRDPHVLSVDDSTRGAARACELARELGHEVTLFVNPEPIVTGKTYWFARLDAILDERTRRQVRLFGGDHALGDHRQVRALRRVIKARIRARPAECEPLLAELAEAVGAARWHVDEHAQTITVEELKRLHGLGVAIENHGWTHGDVGTMSAGEFSDHVSRAQAWLAGELAAAAAQYAVPFGTDRLTREKCAAVPGPVMLTTSEFPEGRVDSHHWNRTEITWDLQRAG